MACVVEAIQDMVTEGSNFWTVVCQIINLDGVTNQADDFNYIDSDIKEFLKQASVWIFDGPNPPYYSSTHQLNPMRDGLLEVWYLF